MKISGNQTAANLVIYKALSSPFSQLPMYRFDDRITGNTGIPAGGVHH
ncbi:hypothetical protein E2C01_020299 [Portunus trituberculatus]|uniref:Uncharacterized protein n=1 Tax=Portunus trituberculatus TaxID=210409 RepID=A0A5B7E1C5_PORTR|nr:hypothetical protein [Portunus trituberculatus]